MEKNIFDIEDKVIIVTGGYGFLGKSICFGLSNLGAKIYLTGNNLKKLENTFNDVNLSNINLLELDIRESYSIKNALETVWQKERRIDVLLNNAVYGKVGEFDNSDETEWYDGIDGTIGGVYRTTKAIVPYFEQNKGGSIINIASIYGLVSPDPSIYDEKSKISPPGYSVGKAGIIQFTKYAACFLGLKGIRVNSISPGPFPDLSFQKSPQFIENLKRKNPLGRVGVPEDLLGVVILLASNASSFITGQNICIDGGWTAW